MRKIFGLFFAFSAAVLFIPGNAFCQEDTSRPASLEAMSLKELLNVKIVSASKKQELLFDAPLSASVITKEDIRRAGSTSIMEALRLVPGMIVREQSNGNYDIHLRGMDNVPPNAPFDITSNTTTLVMIDNRPVYSYLRGGTFWETLPVDLNDVERIEVVRGPAAALYGPNAVNGVINIITRQLTKDGLYLLANAQQGSNLTYINNASVGYRFNKKLSMIASGNYQSRDRTQLSYFEFNRNRWLESPDYFLNFIGDTVRNVVQRYPDQQMAMNKYAGNLFINYVPGTKTRLDVSVGAQHSEAQRVSTENEITPLSTAISNSRYADIRATLKGLNAQFSYNGGTQSTDADPGRKYDFSITGGNLEYNWGKEGLLIKPGISYTSAVYDDRKYSDLVRKTGIFNGRGQITTLSASLRGEYKLFYDQLRLVAGLATNTFNYPDTTYISYQLGATWKVGKKQLFRAVYSSAPRSSNIFDTYVNKTISYNQIGPNTYVRSALEGESNTRLLTAKMLELGYRGAISKSLNLDLELFDIHAKNYNTPVSSRPYTQLSGTDTVIVAPIRSTNLPLQLLQHGITVSLTWTQKRIQLKPFVTLQHTTAKDYAPYANTADAQTPNNPATHNIYSGMGSKSTLKSTPSIYGGASFNYTPASRWNVNLSAYYYSRQIYYHISNIIFNDGRGVDTIQAKLIINASVSYEPSKSVRLFINGKNILNDKSREFFRTDIVPFMLTAGINYEF
ncbi:MAG: TonB-dependent receptor plug domain-containing protein [Bacteroidetes bacterium]|nr:TonB-dependent receptor plug domain-containing protein [Bacteroidota bacterium]